MFFIQYINKDVRHRFSVAYSQKAKYFENHIIPSPPEGDSL
jgi:hypothetical protein